MKISITKSQTLPILLQFQHCRLILLHDGGRAGRARRGGRSHRRWHTPASPHAGVSSSLVAAARPGGLPTPAVLAPRRIRASAATSMHSAASRSGPPLPTPVARLHLQEGVPPRAVARPARLHAHPWSAAGPARPSPTRAVTGHLPRSHADRLQRSGLLRLDARQAALYSRRRRASARSGFLAGRRRTSQVQGERKRRS